MLTSEERTESIVEEKSVSVERTVRATPAEVYRAFTVAHALRDWFCDNAVIDVKKDGQVYLAWNEGYHTAGKITQVGKNKLLSFTWRGSEEDARSEVTVKLADAGEGRTTVTVTHASNEASDEWLEEARRDWTLGLETLDEMLASGNDLRLLRRPMFGMSGADMIDDDVANKYDLPVREGMRLTGLVEGMAAEKAGIRVGDSIVRMAGHPIVSFSDVGVALSRHRAGDTIDVDLYRDGELRTIPVTLGARPAQEMPDSAEGLAVEVRKLYEKVDAELDALVAGVTEAQADWRPSPDEWNAKEILAHILVSERDTQVWTTAIAEDADMQQPFHSNHLTRLRGVVTQNPSLADMVTALKRTEQETLSVIENLTPEAIARKHLFRQLGVWLTGFYTHHEEHFGLLKQQFENALKASLRE